ncbi:MAG: glycosyltransferase [Thioalkalivibrionaceae bacterium]
MTGLIGRVDSAAGGPRDAEAGGLRVAVVVMVRDGGAVLREALAMHALQVPAPFLRLMADTASRDGVPGEARALGWQVLSIAPGEFDHGGTRATAFEHCVMAGADVVVMFTQDAVPLGRDAVARVVAPFADPAVAVAYGRQVPRAEADVFEAFPRCWNYPAYPARRVFADVSRLGIQTAFVSDSFAAWRTSAVREVGGFAPRIIGGEDLQLAARLLRAGYAAVYAADAAVIHSHRYEFGSEFGRYFDIGAMHAQQREVLAPLGSATGAGLRYARAELQVAWTEAGAVGVWRSLLRSAGKWVAYRMGRRWSWWPVALRRRLSGAPWWW